MARLKSWRIFRRSRISPNRMTVIAKAALTLKRQTDEAPGFSTENRDHQGLRMLAYPSVVDVSSPASASSPSTSGVPYAQLRPVSGSTP